jgi:hypothetical protein
MTPWRKRLVRVMTVLFVGGLAGGGVTVYELTNNAAVRQQVIEQLRKHFVGAEITLAGARFRLLGGITIDNLTLYRRDDPSQTPFLHVPYGVIYHDKELLTQGKLAVRKIKLERPRFTIVRGADGRWNVDGILGAVRPDVPIPIVEVEYGTVVLEVAAPQSQPASAAAPASYPTYRLEVRQVQWTMTNDPLAVLKFEGRGQTPAFGPIRVEGDWHRVKNQLRTALDLAPVPFGPALLAELARVAPEPAEAIQEIGGVGRLHLDLRYRADAAPQWWHDLRAELSGGRLVHRDLPLPLENLALTARCVDGQVTLKSLTASAGPAALSLKGEADSPLTPDQPEAQAREYSTPSLALRAGRNRFAPPYPWLAPVRWGELVVEGLPVTPALAARLPAGLQKHYSRYQPGGPVGITCRFDRGSPGWTWAVRLRPADMTGKFEALPYPLHGVRGTLDYSLAAGGQPGVTVDLTAAGPGERPVTIRGTVTGEGPQAAYTFDITGDRLAIDSALIHALPVGFQPVTMRFHPRGHCDVTAHIEFASGGSPVHDYHVTIRDGSMCAEAFPYPLERVTGTLNIHRGPDTVEFPQAGMRYAFRGEGWHGGGRVEIEGMGRPTPHGEKITLKLAGQRVPLDAQMAEAFGPIRMRGVWDMIRPSGQLDFTARAEYTDHPGGPPDLDLTVAPAGVTVQPRFFPYRLTGLRGKFQYTQGLIDFHGFEAQHGATRLSFDGGQFQILSGGGFWADMFNFRAAPLPLDTDLIDALPRPLQTIFQTIHPRATLDVDLRRLTLLESPKVPGPPEPLVIYWNGQVQFTDAALKTGVDWEHVTGTVACEGKTKGQVLDGVNGHLALTKASVFEQPIEQVHAGLVVDPSAPHELRLVNLKGRLFDGQLGGEGRVEYGSGVRYMINLQAIGMKLEEIAKHNHLRPNAQLSGLATAQVYLNGSGGGLTELEGGAHFRATGRMYNLPLVLALLKLPGLRPPNETAFEEVNAVVKVHGKKVQVDRLDLLGHAVSLGGQGEMNMDGTDVKLDLYVVWGNITQLLPPGLRELPPWLSKNLFKIRATGRLGGDGDGLSFAPEPVPVLVDPVRQLVEKVRARQKTEVRGQKSD